MSRITGATTLTRYEMAQVIAEQVGADPGLVQACTADELGWATPRGLKIGLRTEKIGALVAPVGFGEALAGDSV